MDSLDSKERDSFLWLIQEPSLSQPMEAALTRLCEQLVARDIAVWRCSTSIRTRHPEVFVHNLIWTAGEGTKIHLRDHSMAGTASFTASPVARVYTGIPELRIRIRDIGTSEFTIVEDLRAQGASDYWIGLLSFGHDEKSYVSFASRDGAMFSDGALDLFRGLIPYLSARMAMESRRHETHGLLEVYLGQHAARRVLAGAFLRGSGEPLHVAIFFCDLRGFTTLSDQSSAESVVKTLNAYFECTAGPVQDCGGEVLKFIGDAVLGVFHATPETLSLACNAAFRASQQALRALEQLNAARTAQGLDALKIGIALHVGDVMYGNIGAHNRLDFTVIGATVNEACRVESLCKETGRVVLATRAFVQNVAGEGWESVGSHALRGVSSLQELFSPRVG